MKLIINVWKPKVSEFEARYEGEFPEGTDVLLSHYPVPASLYTVTVHVPSGLRSVMALRASVQVYLAPRSRFTVLDPKPRAQDGAA